MTEFIEIRGARENNLKDVSLRIPKRQITIDAGLFSFNSKGACENCKGRRFKDEVLEYKLEGLNVSEILGLTVAQALEAFSQKRSSASSRR